MGNQLVWKDRYNIGVEIIDREHRKLFRILNRLFDFGRQEEKSHWVCQEAVKYFKDHALQHFADEEDYMASIGYEGLKTHRHIHRTFRETTLPALEKELETTNYSEESVSHFLSVCAGWLVGHTLMEDRAIVSKERVN
ncbi:MAG: hemerythrin domain-containing protein, partial [Lachnospiraceae bacterium]|nr:hemerythrin domain-containing protein [Lachnospiraceae bacterium]